MDAKRLKLWADGNGKVYVYVKPSGYVRSTCYLMEGKTTDEMVKNAEKFIKSACKDTDDVKINGTPYKEWLARYPVSKDDIRERKTAKLTASSVKTD